MPPIRGLLIPHEYTERRNALSPANLRRHCTLRNVGLAMLGLCVYSCYRTHIDKSVGEHVARVSWLPNEASDISYSMTYGSHYYEFHISEAGFLAWAKDEGWDVQSIREPVKVARYTERTTSPSPKPAADAPQEVQDRFDRECLEWMNRTKVVVEKGYAMVEDNREHYRVVAYDLKSRRAYYEFLDK